MKGNLLWHYSELIFFVGLVVGSYGPWQPGVFRFDPGDRDLYWVGIGKSRRSQGAGLVAEFAGPRVGTIVMEVGNWARQSVTTGFSDWLCVDKLCYHGSEQKRWGLAKRWSNHITHRNMN